MYNLPVQYTKVKFFKEFLSSECFIAFATEYSSQVKFCADWASLGIFNEQSGENELIDLLQLTQNALTKDEFQ